MSFRKFASVESLGSASFEDSALKKLASSETKQSYYIDGASKIDVVGMLEKHAEKYKISTNPSDYLFEAIRANTVNVPNENHDGFHKNELLRFDTRLKKAVYLTYIGKPHHLNHDTSTPARGIILDAHYNDDAAPLANCPTCKTATLEPENRDASGLHCKCGSIVKDEFIEILVAVDTKKDPKLAEGIRSGLLKAGSMGCFVPGTLVTMADGTGLPIEEVRPGDRIVTHSGKIAEVAETSVHEHEDDVFKIEVQGLVAPIVATGNHPFWIVDPATGEGTWVDADQLKVGQYLRCPKASYPEVEADTDFARLLGYFVSEGNFIKAYDGPHTGKRVGIEFSFAITEQDYVDEVVALLAKHGLEARVYERPTRNIQVVRVARCIELAERFYELVGQHAVSKTLSSEILAWPREAQLHFIGTWLNGDGYSIHDKDHSWIGITTSSLDLRNQLSQMLVNLGIPFRQGSMEGGFSGSRTSWNIFITGDYQLLLARYSDKVKRPHGIIGKVATLADDHGLLRKIKKISTEAYSGPVYNFEVDDEDHSYIAGGVAVHNCSCASTICNVCEHVARSTKDFCQHIKSGGKGTLWKREGSKFVRIEAEAVKSALKKAGYALPNAVGNKIVSTSLIIPEQDFEVRKAFEYCQGVEFDEYSRVHRPADPQALQIEILKAASHGVSIEQETEELIRRARAAQIQGALMSKAAKKQSNFVAVRVNANDEDIHVGADLSSALRNAEVGKRDSAEYFEIQASSEREALTRAISMSLSKAAQYIPVDADVQLVIPDGVQVHLDEPGQGEQGVQPVDPQMQQGPMDLQNPDLGQEPGMPGEQPRSIEDVTQEEQQEPEQSPEEYGMLPPGAALDAEAESDDEYEEEEDDGFEPFASHEMKFAQAYSDLAVHIYEGGKVYVKAGAEKDAPAILQIQADLKGKSTEEQQAYGRQIMASLQEVGLVRTAKKFSAGVNPKLASILDGASWNMAETPSTAETSILDGAEMPQAETTKKTENATSLGKMVEGGDTDMTESRPPMAKSTLENAEMPQAETAPKMSPGTSITEGADDDKDGEEPSFSMNDSILDNADTNMKTAKALERQKRLFEARLASQKAEFEAELETYKKAYPEMFARALKAASKRRALNIEVSPLKATIVDSLTVTRPVGRSASTGEPIEYQGLPDNLALHLVEAAWDQSADEEIESLVSRAAEIMEFDEQYLLSMEKDLARQASVVPPVVLDVEEPQVSEESRVAMETRRAALQGNLPVATVSTDLGSKGLRERVREALTSQVGYGFRSN